MSARIQNAAFFFSAAVAVSLLGCASDTVAPRAPSDPVDLDPVELSDPDGPEQDYGVEAWGVIRQEEEGAPLANAVVCDFYDHTICDLTDDDGTFELDGLRAGAMGLLSVHAEDRTPVLVPVDFDQASTFIELAVPGESMHRTLLKAGDITEPEGNGAVRFQVWKQEGYGGRVLHDVSWRPVGSKADLVSTADVAADARVPLETWAVGMRSGMRAFRWNAESGSLLCSRRSGWRGEGYGMVVVPVLQGYVTHVEMLCQELHL